MMMLKILIHGKHFINTKKEVEMNLIKCSIIHNKKVT